MDVPSYEFDQLIENNARKKYSCPMCQEIIIFAYRTNCNHRFCKYCITKWMMYFKDCPICRQKLTKIAPHLRTDKWIQQLFDMATSDYRQDREMCINYRKLQQVKLELLGSDGMSLKNVNHDKLIEEFTSGNQAVGPPNDQLKAENPLQPRWRLESEGAKFVPLLESEDKAFVSSAMILGAKEDEMRPIYVKEQDPERSSRPSSPQLTKYFEKPNKKDFVNDVTMLFGAESATQFSEAFIRSQGCDLQKSTAISDLSSSVRSDRISVGEDEFPNGVNSAHTYALHFKDTTGLESKLLTLTELTCHEDAKDLAGESSRTGTTRSTGADGDVESNLHASDMKLAEPESNPSELTKALNSLKADTIKARIQHEIAMASLPSGPSVRQSSSAVSTTQKEKQDLQTCRDALMNLRLRLLPPSKKVSSSFVKDKHTFSDIVNLTRKSGTSDTRMVSESKHKRSQEELKLPRFGSSEKVTDRLDGL